VGSCGYLSPEGALARGGGASRRAGLPLIRADTDLANAPMAAAFRALGFSRFATRRGYLLRL
jgi:hypothetical protein